MSKRAIMAGTILGGFLFSTLFLVRGPAPLQAQGAMARNHSQSDEQVSGPYEVVKNWPKPLATLWPAENGWTWGATRAIYPENPHLVFISIPRAQPITQLHH